MKVLLLGGGGREHALAWKLARSPRLTKLWCAPGNVGTALWAENVSLQPDAPAAVAEFVRAQGVELVVVGPEAPLVAGVADPLLAAGVAVFGPVAAGAALEGSKAFAKEVMVAAGVPTAGYRVFEDAPEQAEAYARHRGRVVVKADGLAAGKGVVVAANADEGVAAVRALAGLGASGRRLVLEEVLDGPEVSVIALCDGERFALLPPAQDHKRVGEGDVGPNTGGMGAYSPVPFVSAQLMDEVGQSVIAPTLAELRRRGISFRGALYAGLMLTSAGPRVLEFNTRLGDPEAQVLMMQVEDDLLPVLDACARGELAAKSLRALSGATVGVVLAAEGYPGTPRQGDRIEGLANLPEGAQVFHAGTRLEGDAVVTAGGRVLTVCARGPSLTEARHLAYAAVERIRFRGMHFRRDIAARGAGALGR